MITLAHADMNMLLCYFANYISFHLTVLHVCACTCLYVCACVSACMCICVSVCVCVCMCVYVRVCVHVCICVYLCVCTCYYMQGRSCQKITSPANLIHGNKMQLGIWGAL